MTPGSTDSDIVISDTHLLEKVGRGGVLCEVLERIRLQKPRVRRFIIAGDLLHRNPRFGDPDYFIKKSAKHPKHARALEIMLEMEKAGTEFIIIPGNHDSDIAFVQMCYNNIIPGRVVPADEGYSWRRGNELHFAIHGHQPDPTIQYSNIEFLTDVYDIFRLDREKMRLSRRVEKFVSKQMMKERNRCVPPYVMKRARKLGARYAYWGHTHTIVDHLVVDGVIGYGIGSFAEYPASYVEVTDRGPKLRLIY
jgi:UDP-2,3-diacylglucosamine pyrophosphatase LpxH